MPGILIALCLAGYVMVQARIQMIPLGEPARWVNIWATFKEAIWALMAPVVILGGIYGGVFTPTEAAGSPASTRRHLGVRLQGVGLGWCSVEHPPRIDRADRADHDHRVGRRGLRLADHDQRRRPGARRLHSEYRHVDLVLLLTINVILLFVGSMLSRRPPFCF